MIKRTNIKKDIIAGIIVALVSIPISMGYASIAGLPVVYGLYGSLIPIFIFALITSSPQFVVGVDAMPAVMVGGVLASMGIVGESKEALEIVPLMSIMVAIWFIIFYIIRAGRVVKYISTPVMGGFISGVGATIILMQIPKLFGGQPGTGEIFVLIAHIVSEVYKGVNFLSLILGISTVLIILICKKYIPRVPMTAIMLVIGALLQVIFHLDRYGVAMLPEVDAGLPHFFIPNISWLRGNESLFIVKSLSIALVIMAQTLLASGSYAMKYGDKLDNNRELLAYSAMNFASGFIGVCPINGSVSRSGIADSYGARSQIMSFSASFMLLLVLLFGTPFLKFLPVPILTGIVMTALIGILDIKLFVKLWKSCKNECLIFFIAFLGVLIFGTVNGVVIGVALAFFEVGIKAVVPPTTFLGRIPGQGNYFDIKRNSLARPIKNAVIYRFSGNLFFANVDRFQSDIENSIKDDTKVVVVDARGVGSLDITAVDRLMIINKSLRDRGIMFYFTEHDGSLNDQMRLMGAESLIDGGVVRRTISLALRDAGMHKPYDLEELEEDRVSEADEKLPEFEWAFGTDAKERMESLASQAAEEIVSSDKPEENASTLLAGHGVDTKWGHIGLYDEDEFLDYLTVRLETLAHEGKLSDTKVKRIESIIEKKRANDASRLNELNPHALSLLSKHRHEIHEYIKKKYPEEYKQVSSFQDKENE